MIRSLWLRISLGALAVFVVGTAVVHLGRRARDTVKVTINSDSPLPIPLAGLVPFRVDGAELGSLRRLEFLRSSPSQISGVRVVVELANDSLGAGRLAGCRIGMRSLEHVDARTSFSCVTSDSGLEEFGFVFLRNLDDSMPLYLPTRAVTELRAVHIDFGKHGVVVDHPGGAVEVRVDADSIRQQVARELQRAAAELEQARESVPARPEPPPPPGAAGRP